MPTKIALRRPALAAAAPTPAAPATTTDAPPPPAPAPSISNLWKGVIGVEGEPTGDGRMIDPNALGWQGLPFPLRYCPIDKGAHGDAVVVGRIFTIAREGGLIFATGDFDMGSKDGCEAQRQVALGLTTGISMDLDNIAFEYRVSAEVMAQRQAEMDDLFWAGRTDQYAPDRDYPPNEPDIGGPGGSQTDADVTSDDAAGPATDPDGRVTVMQFNPDDELEVTTSARIRAATIVALPAFSQCHIAIVPADAETPGSDSPQATPPPPPPAPGETVPTTGPVSGPQPAVTASVPVSPPSAWFSNPGFKAATPLHVGEDGRVYGHIAEWGTCHTGYADQCVSPPTSKASYAYFRTGAILTREGTEIAVGQLTMDTRHAGPEVGANAAMRHYDHTGTAFADVAAGEDVFGIWVAGALRTGLSPSQVRAARAAPLSGDWRRIAGGLELIAALSVNVPGFPIPRTAGMVASGKLQTLVASGMIAPRKVIAPGTAGAFSESDLRYLQRVLAREKDSARDHAGRMFRVVNAPVLTRARALAAVLAAAAPPDPNAAPADQDTASMPPDTPAGEPADPKYNGWLVRNQQWVFDPSNDGDDDYTPEGDTDHDYWDAQGNQIQAIPASPDGSCPAKPLPDGSAPETDPSGKNPAPAAAPAAPAGTTAVRRISLRQFASPAPPVPPAKPAAPAPPANKNNGWVQRDGKWIFDPDGDGDNDAVPDGDTDHDYFDKNGKQIKAIPPDPDGKQGMPLAPNQDKPPVNPKGK